MDFTFSPREQALRAELRAFLAETLRSVDTDSDSATSTENFEQQRWFNRQLAQRGWIAPAWPKQYGGLGASYIEQTIFAEELAYHRAPPGQRVFGVGMLGPTLIVHGTEEQKREHLPRITSGEVCWCQGYSEPGAGSDLASLKTAAVRDGDDYVVNGQKIWTTGAHVSDWMFLVARTNPDAPQHRGISFLLVDMRTPGITVRPLVNMAGKHEFNEVFFEDVRVPVRNRVGEENNGWYVAMTLLDFERSSVGVTAAGRRLIEELTAFARERGGLDAVTRGRLAEAAVEIEVARMMSYRVAWMQQAGLRPNYEASMVKVFATEMMQRLYNVGVNLLKSFGTLEPGSAWAPLRGRIEHGYLVNVAPTIYSGSNEIQRNIIATRGLGLPR
ncbi:MAG TPA: acyl-CoA dehydrogenase family protein [Dehalococcoidia bacterium]|nr:acyl-CoA dehydrogenase family protein [Dehalococcoidia bacterium]